MAEERTTEVCGIEIVDMHSLYIDEATIIEPARRLYQINGGGSRYYYEYTEAGGVRVYPSVTTILRSTMPTPPHLLAWYMEKGPDAKRYTQERADYGSFMHGEFAELAIARTYDLDELPARLARYVEAKSLPRDFIYYADDLKSDMLAFAQFLLDYDVRPIAIEIALSSPRHGYAGMIDLVCTMLEHPDSDERITAIVDFKSGRHGFSDENAIQLGLYRSMWNENFANAQVDAIFNFAPKAWRKKPSYTLKEQTANKALRKIPYLLALSRINGESHDDTLTHIAGRIDLEKGDVSGNVNRLSVADLIAARISERNTETAPAVEDESCAAE